MECKERENSPGEERGLSSPNYYLIFLSENKNSFETTESDQKKTLRFFQDGHTGSFCFNNSIASRHIV